MPKSVEQLAASTGGSTAETNGMGGQEKPFNQAGVYEHPKSGERIIAKAHPLFGNAQADAMVRLGFEWVREATPDELKEQVFLPRPADNGSADDIKGVLARLQLLENENTALKAEKAAESNEALGDETSTKTPKKEDK